MRSPCGVSWLVLGSGSSREFAGFDDAVEEAVVGAILRRAAEFLPALAPLAQQAGAEGLPLPPEQLEVRVGLRPWGECCCALGLIPAAPCGFLLRGSNSPAAGTPCRMHCACTG